MKAIVRITAFVNKDTTFYYLPSRVKGKIIKVRESIDKGPTTELIDISSIDKDLLYARYNPTETTATLGKLVRNCIEDTIPYKDDDDD